MKSDAVKKPGFSDRQPKDNIEKPVRFLELFLYANAFIVGFIIMAFEMLGSRYLNPYFGSGIFTWASLISTVLMALSLGYFVGGLIADRKPSIFLLGFLIFLTSAWFGLIPTLSDSLFELVFDAIEDIRYGSLISAILMLFVPLTLLGVYSPFAIRLTLRSTNISGTISGRIFGISTLGSIFGTLVTTFYLIPLIGTQLITYILSISTLLCGLSFFVFGFYEKKRNINLSITILITIAVIVVFAFSVSSQARAGTFRDSFVSTKNTRIPVSYLHPNADDLIERVETPYNSIFIFRYGSIIIMSHQGKKRSIIQSIINLENEKELPAIYTQIMPVGLVYVDNPMDILMLGLGGGMTTRYIQRYFPGSSFKVVELDRGVIELAKKYFKVKETEGYKIIEGDARVYLNRNKDQHDIIMIDAFRGGYVPFHLLTKEFYNLVKDRLKDDGCFVLNLDHTTKLFESSLKTLHSVFESVDVYTSPGIGNAIAVAYNRAKLSKLFLIERAISLQREHNFYYDMHDTVLMRRNVEITPEAKLLTDDFAPVNVYKNSPRLNQSK